MTLSEPANSTIALENQIDYKKFNAAYSIGMDLLERNLSIITLDKNLHPPKSHKEYLSSSLRISEKVLRMLLPTYPNLGVVTGKNSMNLFVIRAQSLEDLKSIGGPISENLNWVSRSGKSYDAWFLCWDGEVTNKRDIGGLDILGRKEIVIVPGSILQDGSMAEWVHFEGQFPPRISQEEIEISLDVKIYIIPRKDRKSKNQITEYTYQSTGNQNNTVIDKLLCFSEQYDFGKGKSGANKRLVFRELIEKAKIESHKSFRATSREIALKIPVSQKSISKYLREFEQNGLIEKCKDKGNSSLGSLYSFKTRTLFSIFNNANKEIQFTSIFPNHEIWSPRGLGPTGKLIIEKMWRASELDQLTITYISQLSRLSRATVGKMIGRLEEHNLVYKDNYSWRVVKKNFTLDYLNDISETLGANEFYRDRKKRIDRERQEYLIGIALYRPDQYSMINRPSASQLN